nr:MAG TPA: hypothetical protein [Bacteriophage sp.]
MPFLCPFSKKKGCIPCYARAPIGSQGFGPIFKKAVKARKTGIYSVT